MGGSGEFWMYMPPWLCKVPDMIGSWVQSVKLTWANHGTKILGFGAVIVGTLASLDHEFLHTIGETFGPAWGPRIIHWMMIIGGFATSYRGFSNQKKAQDMQDQILLLQQQHQILLLQQQVKNDPH